MEENSMSDLDELMRIAISHELKPGEESIPTKLLSLIEKEINPIQKLSDIDQANVFFEAIDKQFALDFVRASGRIPTDEELNRWVLLIRWISNGIQEWKPQNDLKYHKLTALFFAVEYCDIQNTFWECFSENYPKNKELAHVLMNLLGNIKHNFISTECMQPYIWEREAVEKFALADAKADWITVDEIWGSVTNASRPNLFIRQAVKFLYYFGLDHLKKASDNVRQVLIAKQIIESLNVSQRMQLACQSENPYIHFVCVYTTFYDQRETLIDATIENMLVKVLSKIALDEAQWKSWMHVFNQYPLRREDMQAALGMTLAFAPSTAISVYVKTIILNQTDASDASRNAVAKCLRVFSKNATPEVRKVLWETAYRRWKEWNFGLTESSDNIFRITYSEIDYAVVAYIVECMTNEKRAGIIDELKNNFFTLDNSWHASKSEYFTAHYKIFSELQIYLHANNCTDVTGEDLLISSNSCYLADTQNHDYYSIKLNN